MDETAQHDRPVARLQRPSRHPDLRQLTPSSSSTAPLGGANRLRDVQREEDMRINELELVTTPSTRTLRRVSHAGDRVIGFSVNVPAVARTPAHALSRRLPAVYPFPRRAHASAFA